MKKKILSIILSLAMVLCMIPATAVESFAGGPDGKTLVLDDETMNYTMHKDENYNFQDEPEEKQWYYQPSSLVLNPSQAGYYQLEFTYFYTELDDRKVSPSFADTKTQDYFNDITKLSDKNVIENKVLKKRTVPFYIDTEANGPLRMNMSYWAETYVTAFFGFRVELVPVAESDLSIGDITLDLAGCFINNQVHTPNGMLSEDETYYQLPNKDNYTMADLRDNVLFNFSYNYYNDKMLVFDHTKRNPDIEITKYIGSNYFNISDDGMIATRRLDYGYHVEAQILDGNGNPMDMRESNSNLQLGTEEFYSICLKMYDRSNNVVYDKTYRFRTSGVQEFEVTGIENIQAADWLDEMTKTGEAMFEYDCEKHEQNPTVDELLNYFYLDYSVHGSWGEDKNGLFAYLKALTEDKDYSVSAVVTDVKGKIYTAEDGYLPKGNYTISIYSGNVLMTSFIVNMIHDEYDYKVFITDAKVSVPQDSWWEYEDGVYKYGYSESDACSNISPADIEWNFVFEQKNSAGGDKYEKFDSYQYYWSVEDDVLYYYDYDRYSNKVEIRIKDGNGKWVSMEDESCLPFGKYELIVSINGKVCDTLKMDLYASHEYLESWSYDEAHHWIDCINCDDKKDYETHKCENWKHNEYIHWKQCSICGAEYNDVEHKLVTTITKKATDSVAGKSQTKCSVCGEVTGTSNIYAANSIKLEKTTYVYDGNIKKPSVTVKSSDGKVLKKDTDYTVSYASGCKAVGKYKVTVKGTGKYSFTKNLYFTINPKATTVSSVTPKVKSFTVKWAKKTTQVTGYEVQYSTSSTFKTGAATKKVIVKSNTTGSKTIKSLRAKKTYYIRVRTYKTVNSVKYYSTWSAKKTVKTN